VFNHQPFGLENTLKTTNCNHSGGGGPRLPAKPFKGGITSLTAGWNAAGGGVFKKVQNGGESKVLRKGTPPTGGGKKDRVKDGGFGAQQTVGQNWRNWEKKKKTEGLSTCILLGGNHIPVLWVTGSDGDEKQKSWA